MALGVAQTVDVAAVTAEELRAALLHLTSDEKVAARCAAIKRQAREEGGAARAAELIEAELPIHGAR